MPSHNASHKSSTGVPRKNKTHTSTCTYKGTGPASPSRPRKLPLSSLRLRPIPNSYWATPLLLACEYPWSPFEASTQKLDKLLAAGVRTFIDLTEPEELMPYKPHLPRHIRAAGLDATTISYHQFPIPDRSLPHKPTYFMRLVLDVLRENAEQGRVCAVHCRGGIGRTGLVIGCWLVDAGIARDGEEALKIIEREWRTVEKCKRFPHSPETGPQFEFVRNFRSPAMVSV